MRALAAALLLSMALGGAASAQRVSGSVVSAVTNAAVPGALVSVHATGSGDAIATVLTRSDGAFQIALPANSARLTLLVRSIGLKPVRLQLPPMNQGRDTTIRIVMQPVTQVLPVVEVREVTSCPSQDVGTRDVAELWDEVSKALENSRLTRDQLKMSFDFVVHQRERDAYDGRVLSFSEDTIAGLTARPFRAASPAAVRESGYVLYEFATVERPDPARRGRTSETLAGDGWTVFLAPDEVVLLDVAFQDTHCFWASPPSQNSNGMIGLHFLPVAGLRKSDIRGTFWLQPITFELRRVSYRYTRVSVLPLLRRGVAGLGPDTVLYDVRSLDTEPTAEMRDLWEPGGEMEYRRLPNGSFVVSSWNIWTTETWTRAGLPGELLAPPRRLMESGGEVVDMRSGGVMASSRASVSSNTGGRDGS